MKDGIKQILGKHVAGAVVATEPRSPRPQLFLTFLDGTYFEIGSDNFNCAGGIDDGGATAVLKDVRGMGVEITEVYADAEA